jgi:hypothetical protein
MRRDPTVLFESVNQPFHSLSQPIDRSVKGTATVFIGLMLGYRIEKS